MSESAEISRVGLPIVPHWQINCEVSVIFSEQFNKSEIFNNEFYLRIGKKQLFFLDIVCFWGCFPCFLLFVLNFCDFSVFSVSRKIYHSNTDPFVYTTNALWIPIFTIYCKKQTILTLAYAGFHATGVLWCAEWWNLIKNCLKTGWFDCFYLRPTWCAHSLRTPLDTLVMQSLLVYNYSF